MFDPVRIALVAEGPTDRIVIEAALHSTLHGREFILQQLQPENSLAFGNRGGGWPGVYKWCKQAVERGNGTIDNDKLLFLNYDILIIHLDADVASQEYSNGNIHPQNSDLNLPCTQRCPPSSATTAALINVLYSWCNMQIFPSNIIPCIPSKNTEAWVVTAIDRANRFLNNNPECYSNPDQLLQQLPLRKRIRKCQKDYKNCFNNFVSEWPHICNLFPEAASFQLAIDNAFNFI